MNNVHTDLDSMITTFNRAVTETASEITGKHRQKKRKEKNNTPKTGSLQKCLICATEREISLFKLVKPIKGIYRSKTTEF